MANPSYTRNKDKIWEAIGKKPPVQSYPSGKWLPWGDYAYRNGNYSITKNIVEIDGRLQERYTLYRIHENKPSEQLGCYFEKSKAIERFKQVSQA